jgi:hypothetical protein
MPPTHLIDHTSLLMSNRPASLASLALPASLASLAAAATPRATGPRRSSEQRELRVVSYGANAHKKGGASLRRLS